MRKSPTRQIYVRDQELFEAAEAVARAEDTSLSRVVERALRAYMSRLLYIRDQEPAK